MKQNAITINQRTVEHHVNELFPQRWSPRAMNGEKITKEELMSLFEAARWAPSSSNSQPWKFIYAMKGTAQWDTLLNLLVPFNQSWAENGSVLMVIIAKKTYGDGKISKTYAFDAGLAYENLALQGSMMNLVVHGMGGFDYAKAKTDLNIPEEYEVIAMSVVGKHGNVHDLPEGLQEREHPSDRIHVEQFVVEGKFH
jgi:nitroreductase